MTPEQQQFLVTFFVINLPVVMVIIIGQRRGWWIDGRAHERELAEKDKFIAFVVDLWKTTLEEKKSVELKSSQQSEAMKELTSVVRDSLNFNRELVEDAGRRSNSDRPRTRRVPRRNTQGTGEG